MVDEINDEADDALEDYSELIVKRMLAGRELPKPNNGSNNSYSIVPIGAPEAAVRPHIDYYDAEVYIPEKEETEPARVLTTIFQDADGAYYELKVATPTFEKDDLLRAILYWVVFLYLLLLLTTISLTVWVFHRSMRPLYELLRWLDDYTPGRRGAPVPCSTRIVEFRRLVLRRSRPSTVPKRCSNSRNTLSAMRRTSCRLRWPCWATGSSGCSTTPNPPKSKWKSCSKCSAHCVRSCGSTRPCCCSPRSTTASSPRARRSIWPAVVGEQVALYDEIYAGRGIACTVSAPEAFVVRMNESLASTLVTNLLKNAYLHTAEGGAVGVELRDRTLTVTNDGTAPLDAEHIFERFYQGARKEGSTGLGLALVSAVGRYYGLRIDYRFEGGATAFRFVGRDFFEKTEKNSLRRGIFKFVSKSRMNFASSNKDNVQFIKKTKRHEKASDSRRRSVRPRHLYRQCRQRSSDQRQRTARKGAAVHPPAFPQRKGLLRQDGARTLRYDLRGDLHQQLQGRIPEKRRLERGRLQIFDGSCRDHPSADRAVRFPVLSRYVRRPVIHRDKRDYEVKLTNGLELTFDLKFNLIDIDD